mmetsp:Transcript_4406/g.28111  ORF Transcript_4406/g.28111 Transcript_4406/m.28111 type:complete len:309 (+) Transcript_4406:788-1714(+)|eukprot:CAMPEP_0183830756 /NCGR_PEP_ID=MMETSP0807_2-20130328/4211_1 /TAXON_ID=88271 /ORGANISM="Picocystis salinarum, Strain CCMP1897" /LENGTH=308 /DNA_ID=CAMNT_0026076139 /DNA_START=107 /DNA_END=1033 /DNA_ORIENTATION=+
MPPDARGGDRGLESQPSLMEQLGTIGDVRLADLFKEPPQKLGSMNMDELLQSIFQSNEVRSRLGTLAETPQGSNNQARMPPPMTGQTSFAALMRQDSWNLTSDTRNKTVEEVWRQIEGQDGTRTSNYGSISLGELLNRAGAQVGGPTSTPGKSTMHQMRGVGVPEISRFTHPLISAGAAPTANLQTQVTPSFAPFSKLYDRPGPDRAAAAHARAARMKKRKERKEQRSMMEEEGLLADKRLVKNRESAARSRQRRKLYTEELEQEVAQLRMELQALREEHNALLCQTKSNEGVLAGGLPLRRTRSLKD